MKSNPDRNTVLAEKLSKAIQQTPHAVKKKEPPPQKAPIMTDSTPPLANISVRSFRQLKAGDLLIVEYPMEKGRIPGEFGAEVVTVSKDFLDVSIKFLYQNKPAKPGSLKAIPLKDSTWTIVDVRDERGVNVKIPNLEQRKVLEELRKKDRKTLYQPVTLNQVVALVYPKGGCWTPGVALGQVTSISADGHTYTIQMYFPQYVESKDMAAAPEVSYQFHDGRFTDTDYACELAMVRAASPAEASKFHEERMQVQRALASRKE